MSEKHEVENMMCVAVEQYKRAYDTFRDNFRSSKIGREWKQTVDAFIHNSNRHRCNLQYAIDEGNIPTIGVVSIEWKTYHAVLTATGIMDLILYLANGDKAA